MKINQYKNEYTKLLSKYGLLGLNTDGFYLIEYDYGETLMETGSQMKYIMIIIKGETRVSTTSANGRNLILSYYVQEGILGDLEFMTNEDYVFNTVTAQSPTLVLAIPYQEYRLSLMNNLVFIRKLAQDLAFKTMDNSNNYTERSLLSAEARLCRYIIATSRNNIFMEIMNDVAMSTGMSYRHLHRILAKLCKEEVLEKRVNGYYILDEKKLKSLAEL